MGAYVSPPWEWSKCISYLEFFCPEISLLGPFYTTPLSPVIFTIVRLILSPIFQMWKQRLSEVDLPPQAHPDFKWQAGSLNLGVLRASSLKYSVLCLHGHLVTPLKLCHQELTYSLGRLSPSLRQGKAHGVGRGCPLALCGQPTR